MESYTYNIINNRCTIQFHSPQYTFCQAIKSLFFLPSLTTNTVCSELSFIATSVDTLSSFIKKQKNWVDYDKGVRILTHLGIQIFFMEKNDSTFAWLSPEHILVINETAFFYIGLDHIVPIRNKEFLLTVPPSVSCKPFLAPEYKCISTLPAHIDYRASYYSLAKIILFNMFPHVSSENYMVALRSIIDTNLYWSILNCLEQNPHKRKCLVI